jgi:patatin-related protein
VAAEPGKSTPAPSASPGGASQEIRFAVVMYGGVSLAIYIHGVAQELLRLVRATSGADLDGDEVAKIYAELSGKVRDQSPPGDDPNKRCQTRFVIDILSGTSAGGINAVFLAKALAIQSKDLEKLRQTWLTTADMDKLLDRGGVFEPKRALLNGHWMYEQLYKAFRDMNSAPRDAAEDCEPVERLDLFVTTTDLNGVSIPIRLADMAVPEKVHKGSFNFRFDNTKLAKGGAPDGLDVQLDHLVRDDFQPDFDAMLAFASRCTSSFPIAFAPMKLADIEVAIGKDAYQARRDRYRKFFRWIPLEPLFPSPHPVDFDQREFADGGYLDNKPFGHVIDALAFRATKLRHSRKLLFVDPFPEIAGGQTDKPHFDFVDNALDGAMNLPRYQTIREEISRVNTLNNTQIRLHALQELVTSEYHSLPMEDFNTTIEKFENTTVRALTARYGPAYATYHEVRLLDSTDDLAHTLSGLHESVQSQDLFLAFRYIVRAWREAKYAPNEEDYKKSENQFFSEFDYSFRMRRTAHLLEWAQSEKKPELCEALILQLIRLLRMRERLSLPDQTNPIWATVESSKVLTGDKVMAILEPITDDGRLHQAEILLRTTNALQGVADQISNEWNRVFSSNRAALKKLLDQDAELKTRYQRFDFIDMVSLAFLEGSELGEHTGIEVYRISPADGIPRSLETKLAGYALQDFGAFLKLEWRQNDILWGRLDACERIVSAVLNHEGDEDLRTDFVRRLQRAIVEQEAKLRNLNSLAPALDAIQKAAATPSEDPLQDYLLNHYVLPCGPKPKDSARQIAQAADILGRMIEEDLGEKNKLTGLLRSIGGIGAGLVGLLSPGGLGRVFWNYWLALLGLMAALLWLLASFAGEKRAKILGIYGVVAVVLVWFISWIIGRVLAGKRVPVYVVRVFKWLPAVAVVVLVIIGWLHLPEELQNLWRRLAHV